MTTPKTVIGFALAAALALGSAGCREEDGPMEKAGRHLDEAATEMAERARGLSDEGKLERIGRHLDEATEETKQAFEEAAEAIGEEFEN
jgi:hypothetical protein